MDHRLCFEHVVVPEEGATCESGREVIWRDEPYMDLEVVRCHHRCAQRPFNGGEGSSS